MTPLSIKCLASWLLVGSASLISLPAWAQIPVTGGRITGDAAFFVPNTGNTVLFDLGTRTLRLNTPNGVTVDSRFQPTASSINPIGNRLPAAGDRGVLEGSLSGRAFDVSGSPVFFSNVPTRLNFTVNSFNPAGGFNGTFITPTSSNVSARIFLPIVGVSLDSTSAQSFAPVPGILSVGVFDANLPSGVIALPNTLRFGTPLVSEFAVPDTVVISERRLSFRLEGVGIPNPPGTSGDPLGSFFDPFFVGGIRFSSGNATTNFLVQLDGTPLTIAGSGNFATIIEIQGITPASSTATPILPGNNPFAPAVSYSVIGAGSGSATNSEPLRFSSVNSATAFVFQDALGNKAQGISVGATNIVIAGAAPFTVSRFTGLTPNASFNAFNIDNTAVFTAALVRPPSSLIAGRSQTGGRQTGSSQTNGSQTASGQTVGGSAVIPTSDAILSPPPTTFVTPNLSQATFVSGSGGSPVVMVLNPALPGSAVFPNLGATPVPIVAGGNSISQLLNTSQNLTFQDNTLRLGADINQLIGGFAQEIAAAEPPSPHSSLLGNNSVITAPTLNVGNDLIQQLTAPGTSGRNNLDQSVGIFNGLLGQANRNPESIAQLNHTTGAFINSEIARQDVMNGIRAFESKRRVNVGPGGGN